MDARKRGFQSLPPKGPEYRLKRELSERKSLPLCPPLPAKLNRKAQKSLFQEKSSPKPVFVNVPVSLSVGYCPEKDQSYLEQVFTNITQIGEGSFGVVYKASSREDDTVYAIKQFKLSHNINYGYAEVENMEKIGKHRNFVEFIKAWEEDKIIHIQMEYCSLSLAQYANTTQKILEDQLWYIMFDMLQALHFLHTKNLVHLDVKPGNILVSKGFYKLADFGLLVDLNKNGKSKISTISDGDAKYLACEVLDGVYTYSCDIFGLGISLLELATNIELPEYGPLWHQIRKQSLPAVLYEDFSKPFCLMVEKMMKNQHWERPQASTLLKNLRLRKIQLRDSKHPRQNFCEIPEEPFTFTRSNSFDNNNIVETPRRPLLDIRNSLSNSGSSHDTSQELTSDDSCRDSDESSRRNLSRVKLLF